MPMSSAVRETVREIKKIFESPGYLRDLSELSCYAESIMQERPMVYLLSKYLYEQGHKFELEQSHKYDKGHRKHDLVVDKTIIEFKFHYDFDIDSYLRRELSRYKTHKQLWEAVKRRKIHKSWSITPGIYKDVVENKADIFVWVICARNLRRVNKDARSRINQSEEQNNYNKHHKYGSTKFLAPVDSLLGKLQKLRKFSIDDEVIITTKPSNHFPSIYYLRLCEFE